MSGCVPGGESVRNFADNSRSDSERRLISDHARHELEDGIEGLPEAFALDGAHCDRMVAGVLAGGGPEGLAHSARTS